MPIYENLTEFCGKKVVDFTPGIPIDPGVAWRLRVDWEDYDEGKTGVNVLENFLTASGASSTTSLIMGDWGGVAEGNNAADLISRLSDASSTLSSLRELFIGDIQMEESEISWIVLSDFSSLWTAYPHLEHLRIRGGEGLSLGSIKLPDLKTLIIESGGLDVSVIRQIIHGELPRLEHLEIWIGDDGYGANSGITDLQPILSGNLFPNLTYLGLRNCHYADELAEAIDDAVIVRRLKVLDLSLGNLSDKGGEALLKAGNLARLEKLDLHHHYLSDDMITRLEKAYPDADLSNQQEADEWDDDVYRFVAVSE